MDIISDNGSLLGSSTARHLVWTKDTDGLGQRRFECTADGNYLGSVTRTPDGYEAFRSGDGETIRFGFRHPSMAGMSATQRVGIQLGNACQWVMAS